MFRHIVSIFLILAGACCAGEAVKSSAFRLRQQTVSGSRVETGYDSCVALDAREFGCDGDHYLLTANHATSWGREIAVEVSSDKWMLCTVVVRDPKNDIALLRCDQTFDHVHPLAPDDPVILIGAPSGKEICIESGNVIDLHIRFRVDHGMSGGPALNSAGKIVGIIRSGDGDGSGEMNHEFGRVVSAACIRAWLKVALKD